MTLIWFKIHVQFSVRMNLADIGLRGDYPATSATCFVFVFKQEVAKAKNKAGDRQSEEKSGGSPRRRKNREMAKAKKKREVAKAKKKAGGRQGD